MNKTFLKLYNETYRLCLNYLLLLNIIYIILSTFSICLHRIMKHTAGRLIIVLQ